MHMADALVSPVVGGAMWVAAGGALAWSARKLRTQPDPAMTPWMGVLGAFVFAAQMINFAIPGTGSSGHLGGGLLLAILVGPEAAVLAVASVLIVQALFFADGGLLALGCNVFNLGVVPAYLALPLWRRIAGESRSRPRLIAATMLAAQVGLLLGATGVVVETTLSGISALPISLFAGAMLPIHAAIAVVEGLVTSAVVMFVAQAQPDLLARGARAGAAGRGPGRLVMAALAAATLVTGVSLSWFASPLPDGLEWSVAKVTGADELEEPAGAAAHVAATAIQRKTALLPDYGFAAKAGDGSGESAGWGAPDAGTSLSGAVGGGITLLVVAAVGLVVNRRRGPRGSGTPG